MIAVVVVLLLLLLWFLVTCFCCYEKKIFKNYFFSLFLFFFFFVSCFLSLCDSSSSIREEPARAELTHSKNTNKTHVIFIIDIVVVVVVVVMLNLFCCYMNFFRFSSVALRNSVQLLSQRGFIFNKRFVVVISSFCKKNSIFFSFLFLFYCCQSFVLFWFTVKVCFNIFLLLLLFYMPNKMFRKLTTNSNNIQHSDRCWCFYFSLSSFFFFFC